MNLAGSVFFKPRLLTTCHSLAVFKRNSYKLISRPDFSKLKLQDSDKNIVGLATRLQQKIELGGPITVADYMKEVLTNPSEGYYMKKDAIGERGDFITSPEISQMFGEILGIWLVNEWGKLRFPRPLQIVEFGPGKGTLLTDILKVFSHMDLNKDDISVHLVEVSPWLQKTQADKLCMTHKVCHSEPHYHEGENSNGIKIYWYKDITNIPKKFSIVLAHEFFDALPIHKFKKTEQGWREILVDIEKKSENAAETKFKYVVSRDETTASKLYVPLVKREDLVDLEVSPQSISLVKELGTRMNEFGGITLIVDYGSDGPNGDTFRAFKEHKQTDPLINPGSADLTADVDFNILKRVAEDAKVVGPVSQRQFLLSTGAEVRLQMLLEEASENDQKVLKSSFNMLTDADKMGECFKFMALFPKINEEHYSKYPISGFDLNLKS